MYTNRQFNATYVTFKLQYVLQKQIIKNITYNCTFYNNLT